MSPPGRLLLAPLDPWCPVDVAAVVARLEELEICAGPLPQWPMAYAAGDAFMRWISFAGCSAFVNFAPETPEDEAFCHLRLTQSPDERPLFVSGPNTRAPLCPTCKQPWEGWSVVMPKWKPDTKTRCPACEAALDPMGLNWRRQAGFGPVLLEFWNIFPGEARPVDGLFDELEKVSGVGWRYFFIS